MSDMDFAVFRQDFIDSCKSMGEEQGIGFTEAFVNNMAEALVSENLIEGWNNCFFRDNRGMYRIDAYALDENGLGQSVTLIISQDAEELLNPDAATLTRTDAAGIFRKLERFLQKAKEGELDDFREQITGLDDCISTLQDNWKQLNKINLVLFTASPVSLLLKNIDDITYEGVTITHQVWSLERIFEAQQEGNDAIVINFEDYVSGGIRCLEATNAQDAEYHSYLAVMPGTVLAQIFHIYGGRLLEGNVRSFLTTKVAVNRGIRSTIKNEPQKFFAYNNGIAVTATDVVIEQDGAGLLLKSAKNFQIINGGQTTASISNALYKDKWPDEVSKIFVQMKLTALEPGRMTQEQTDLLIKNISEFSNTQNKVNKADFFASHPYHRRMSDLSRTNKAPAVGGKQYSTRWYYERSRGQYAQELFNLTAAKQKDFKNRNPKEQLITKTDLAKFLNSWYEKPDTVSAGAQANFMKFAASIGKEWDEDSEQYNSYYFKKCVALAKMFRELEKLVSKAPWFGHSYRANVVCYTMSYLHYLISRDYPGMQLDLLPIWNKQELPETLTEVLDTLAQAVYKHITDPNRSIQNVTQYCKRAVCWERLKSKFCILPDISNLLIDDTEDKARFKQANREQKDFRKMDAQIELYEAAKVDPAFWSKLLQYAVEDERWANPIYKTIIGKASKGIFITEKQCQVLMPLVDAAREEGIIS